MKDDNAIFSMKLHETITENKDTEQELIITRVPGGWIYETYGGKGRYNSVFVPYSEEYECDAK